MLDGGDAIVDERHATLHHVEPVRDRCELLLGHRVASMNGSMMPPWLSSGQVSSPRAVELVVHSSDAEGRSRASFYDTVRVGHTFDLRANGLDCSYRFMVTATNADRSTRSFRIRFLSSHESRCDEVSGSSGPAEGVEFVWGLRPGADPSGSRPTLFLDRPNGPGTYRLQNGSPCVLEVPIGAHLIHDGLFLGITQYSLSDEPLRLVTLRDPGSYSEANLDPEACFVRGGVGYAGGPLDSLRDSFRREE